MDGATAHVLQTNRRPFDFEKAGWTRLKGDDWTCGKVRLEAWANENGIVVYLERGVEHFDGGL